MTLAQPITTKQKVLSKQNHIPFWGMLMGFFALVFVRTVVGLEFPVILLLGYFCVMALLGDRDEILALAVVCIPTYIIFQYKYALLFLILIYAFKFPKDIKLNSSIIPIILMMVWELLHGFTGVFSISEYLRGFSELIFLGFVMSIPQKERDYPFISRALAFATVCMAFMVVYNLLQENGFSLDALYKDESFRLGKSDEDVLNFGLNYNANGLGAICNLAIGGILHLFLLKKHQPLDTVLLVLLMILGVMTLSRSFLLCCAFIFVLFVFAGGRSQSAKLKVLLFGALALIALIIVVLVFMPYVFENYLKRFTEEDILNGRDVLLRYYNNHIFSDIKYTLFGTGLQNTYPTIYALYGRSYNVSHNGIQELVLMWGIPGLLLFVACLIDMIRISKKYAVRHRLANFIPLFFMILKAQSGQVITSGETLLSFVFAYYGLCVSFQKEQSSHDNIQKNIEIY